jgi:hypothetical protein
MYMCQCCKVAEGGFHHTSCSNQNVLHPLGNIVINPGHNLRDRDKVIADVIRKLRGIGPPQTAA